MYIIKNDTLIHVDNSSDILEHYGVLGMKWGQRRALKKAYKREVKKIKREYKNNTKDDRRYIRKQKAKALANTLGGMSVSNTFFGGKGYSNALAKYSIAEYHRNRYNENTGAAQDRIYSHKDRKFAKLNGARLRYEKKRNNLRRGK